MWIHPLLFIQSILTDGKPCLLSKATGVGWTWETDTFLYWKIMIILFCFQFFGTCFCSWLPFANVKKVKQCQLCLVLEWGSSWELQCYWLNSKCYPYFNRIKIVIQRLAIKSTIPTKANEQTIIMLLRKLHNLDVHTGSLF